MTRLDLGDMTLVTIGTMLLFIAVLAELGYLTRSHELYSSLGGPGRACKPNDKLI